MSQAGKCCRPIPGDSIIGYITQGRGVTIHKINCRNIDIAKINNPDRLIEAQWGDQTEFTANLKISATERQGLVNDITSYIIKVNIKLIGLSTYTDTIKNITYVDLDLEVKQVDNLNQLLNKLNEIKGIIDIQR